MLTEHSRMKKAIDDALAGIRRQEGGPFGACIVKNGKVLAVAHNTVLKEKDPTCHAEMNAIRLAAETITGHDLSGCVIYSTTEPCPMCFAAIHWAKIEKVYYGTSIADVRKRGFNELPVSNAILKKIGKSPVLLRKNFMRKECLGLLKTWDDLPAKKVY